MFLRLEAILFNHDLCSATVDAFNLRKDEHDALQLPEWRRGVSTNPKDSPAAYARSETQGNTLTIKVDFSFDGAGDCEIRARDANLHREALNGPDLSQQEVELFEKLKINSEGNVLGEVKARTPTLNNGVTADQFFDLESVRLWTVGVGIHDIVWRWQYRVVGTEYWIDFAITTHRIYTVLNLPTRPWLQDTDETQFPWVEVLEHACEWAGGAQDTDAAAELITIRLNELGQQKLICYGDGSGFYTDVDAFDCNSFIAVLQGKLGKGNSVNCDDCAAVVSTFANLVGCNLVQMCIRSINADFALKPHKRIGLPGIFKDRAFFHHMVAAEGCGEDVEVFDACLQIANDPTGPGIFSLPTNLAFNNGKGSYLSLLVMDNDQPVTHPHPDCKRRRLGPAIGFDEVCVLREPIEKLFEFNLWKEARASGKKVFISDFFFARYIASSLELAALQESQPQARPRSIHSLWKSVSDGGAQPFRIDLYQADSWQDAREVVMKLLASSSSPTLEKREIAGLGEVAFADPEFQNIVFAVGNLVLYLRNLCTRVGPLLEVGRRLTERIFNPPPFVIEDPVPPEGVRRFSFSESDAVVNKKIRIREERPNVRAPRLYQFLAEAGEVSRENGELMYLPESPGAHTLNIFAPDEQGNAVKQTLQLFVHD